MPQRLIFDPSSASYNLTSIGNIDIFVLKLDSSGNFIWARGIGSTNEDQGNCIQSDKAGMAYITGYFNGTVDFDPGSGNFNMAATGGADIFILKLDSAGSFVWAKKMGGGSNDYGTSLALDSNGNIYSTGYFIGGGDFDPGSATYNLSSNGNSDAFISKINSSGNFIWAKNIGGVSNDFSFSMGLDIAGNVYTTGSYQSTVDFDPGSGTFNLTSTIQRSIFISKYSSTGNFLWAKSIDGNSGFDEGYGLSVDRLGNAFVTGIFSGTADFNPGNGTNSITASGGSDIFVLKLCAPPFSPGAISGPTTVCHGDTKSYSISSVIGASGYSWTVPSGAVINYGHNTTTINVSFGINSGNITVTPVNSCSSGLTSSYPITVNHPIIGYTANPSLSICTGSSITLNGTGASTYTWSGGITNGVAFTPTISGVYTVIGTTSNGCIDSTSVAITVLPLPNVNATISPAAIVCAGTPVVLNGTGASTYTWSGAVFNGSPFIPTASGTYTVTGTDTNGCTNTNSISITVTPLPAVSYTANPASKICAGTPITLKGLNAKTYFWSDGIVDGAPFYPTATKTYTLTGTDSLGCSKSIPVTITVNSKPNVGYNVSPDSIICAGTFVTLTGTGTAAYSWSGGVQNGIPFIPSSTKTYTLTGTDTNGCVNTNTVAIVVNPLPIIIAQPLNKTVAIDSTVQFIVRTSGVSVSYQWQENPGNGYSDLFNTAQYSGVTTDTLTIKKTTITQNNFLYRCILKAGNCTDTTTSARLTVMKTGLTNYDNSKNHFSVFPNPAHGNIQVELDEALIGTSYSLLDVMGRQVLYGMLKNKTNIIDISNLKSGLYFIQLEVLNKPVIKFIKQE